MRSGAHSRHSGRESQFRKIAPEARPTGGAPGRSIAANGVRIGCVIRGHGHANTGLDLARADHSLGRRRDRNRAEGAAAAGAELDLDKARDAPAAGAFGAALFDLRRVPARIWWCGAAPRLL